MRCPNCGQWNRASLPKCFKCGTELPREGRAPLPAEELEAIDAPVVMAVDEAGNETELVDEKDVLAAEMRTLHERKRQGETRQRQLRKLAAEKGIAPTGTDMHAQSRRNPMFMDDQPSFVPNEDGDYAVESAYAGPYAPQRTPPAMPHATFKRTRLFGLRRFLPIVALLLVALAAASAVLFVIKPTFIDKNRRITSRRWKLRHPFWTTCPPHHPHPGGDGTQIYIKEWRSSVHRRLCQLPVPDYTWYELDETLDKPILR